MTNSSNNHPVLKSEDTLIQEFDWGQLTWFANGQIGNTDALTVGQCIIKAGYENPRHYHPNCEEILKVTEGTIRHSLGDEAFDMGPGDTIVIPANVPHNAQNVGDTEATMVIVFSSADRKTEGTF